MTFRELLITVCDELQQRGRLSTDLLAFPELPMELALANLLLTVKGEWELPDPFPALPPEDSPPPKLTQAALVTSSVTTLLTETMSRIASAKVADLQALADDPKPYILTSALWLRFTPQGGTRQLWTNYVANDDPVSQYTFPDWLSLPQFVVRAALVKSHLTPDGAAYLMAEGPPLRLTIFGKVLDWDQAVQVLDIMPLAVYV